MPSAQPGRAGGDRPSRLSPGAFHAGGSGGPGASSAEAHYRLGRVLQLQGFRAEAEAAYRHALKLDPEYIGALIGQGEIEADAGRPLEALRRFEAAIEINPHQAEAHFAARAGPRGARPDRRGAGRRLPEPGDRPDRRPGHPPDRRDPARPATARPGPGAARPGSRADPGRPRGAPPARAGLPGPEPSGPGDPRPPVHRPPPPEPTRRLLPPRPGPLRRSQHQGRTRSRQARLKLAPEYADARTLSQKLRR